VKKKKKKHTPAPFQSRDELVSFLAYITPDVADVSPEAALILMSLTVALRAEEEALMLSALRSFAHDWVATAALSGVRGLVPQ
jgi:hypothetical protein